MAFLQEAAGVQRFHQCNDEISVCFLKPVIPVDPSPQTVGFQLPRKKRVLKMLAEVDVFAEALMIGLIYHIFFRLQFAMLISNERNS